MRRCLVCSGVASAAASLMPFERGYVCRGRVGAVVPADLSSRGLFASRAKIGPGSLARFKDLWVRYLSNLGSFGCCTSATVSTVL